MSIEREILIVILKTTIEDGAARVNDVSRESRMPHGLIQEALKRLRGENLLWLGNDEIIVSGEQRLRIAVKAIGLGADIERVARFLTWSEFERFSTLSFEANGFQVKKNLHFTWLRKRWEIDVLGLRKPIVISTDCKHWHQKWSGTASVKAAKNQIERTKALAEASRNMKDKIGISEWEHAYFVPVVLSLSPSQHKFYEGTPIVSILQLKDFLQNVIVHLDEVRSFHILYVIKKNFSEKN